MPEIRRFLGIIITMYFNQHNPSPFHARYGEYKADIAIETLSVIAGHLPPRVLGLVMEWAALHRSELMEDWEFGPSASRSEKNSPLGVIDMFLIDVVHVKPWKDASSN